MMLEIDSGGWSWGVCVVLNLAFDWMTLNCWNLVNLPFILLCLCLISVCDNHADGTTYGYVEDHLGWVILIEIMFILENLFMIL